MNLTPAPEAYSKANEAATRDELRKADKDNVKRKADVYFGAGFGRLLWVEPVTGDIYDVTFPAGVPTATLT